MALALALAGGLRALRLTKPSLSSTTFCSSSCPTRLLSSSLGKPVQAFIRNGGYRIELPVVNPYVVEGCGSSHIHWHNDEGFGFKVDLPGVKREGVKVWVENQKIHFEATEAKDEGKLFDVEDARKFQDSFDLPEDYNHETDEVELVLLNGVLKCTIPGATFKRKLRSFQLS